MSACPHCLSPVPDIAVRGRRYRLRRRTHIKQRYIEAENNEFLYIQPIPVLVIETKERNYARNDDTRRTEKHIARENAA